MKMQPKRILENLIRDPTPPDASVRCGARRDRLFIETSKLDESESSLPADQSSIQTNCQPGHCSRASEPVAPATPTTERGSSLPAISALSHAPPRCLDARALPLPEPPSGNPSDQQYHVHEAQSDC